MRRAGVRQRLPHDPRHHLRRPHRRALRTRRLGASDGAGAEGRRGARRRLRRQRRSDGARREGRGSRPPICAPADWSRFAALVLSPGVPLTHPEPHWSAKLAKAAGVEIIGDIELFCRERAKLAPDAPFVAITGTNGKSTTTALIAHILREAGRDVQMGGNIGTAILSLEPPASDRVHVVEMSSFQIDLTPSLKPTIGVLLNISPDHLDRHGTMEEYAAIKERLVAAADLAVIGIDDEFEPRRRDAPCRLGQAACPHLDRAARFRGRVRRRRSLVSRRWRRPGGLRRHLRHPLAARHPQRPERGGGGRGRGCARRRRPRRSAPASRPSPASRTAWRRSAGAGAAIFVNDSKATNADSTEKALASFERIFWILGGKPKEGGIESLRPYFPKIDRAYLIGEASGCLRRHARRARCRICAAARSTRPWPPRPRTPRARARRGAGRAALAGLRLLRPVPELRGARQPLPRARAGAARHRGKGTVNANRRMHGSSRPKRRRRRPMMSRAERTLVGDWWWTVDRATLAGARHPDGRRASCS